MHTPEIIIEYYGKNEVIKILQNYCDATDSEIISTARRGVYFITLCFIQIMDYTEFKLLEHRRNS